MTKFSTRYASSPKAVKRFDTQELRNEFLIQNVLKKDRLEWLYTHYDRFMVTGVVPVNKSIQLVTIEPLKSGNKEVIFSSKSSENPAQFYLNSTPAHKAFPTKKIGTDDVEVIQLGAPETANARTLRKYIVNSVVDVCQLQMGMTTIKEGSSWNTMPAHVHDRRMEVYFYFEIPEDQAVCHFMGQPQETRHIWMADGEAVISPPWSIHSGSGTSSYSFIWGMAGENLDYGDMDVCKINELR